MIEVIENREALQYLLEQEVVFINYREHSFEDTKQGVTLVVYANCSDVFAWGCADGENISSEDELMSLYNHVKNNEIWGSTIWVIKKRKRQPQDAVIRNMKAAGVWSEELEVNDGK